MVDDRLVMNIARIDIFCVSTAQNVIQSFYSLPIDSDFPVVSMVTEDN